MNPLLVQIAGNRIISGGINPKTGNVYKLSDITNQEFHDAVKAYIDSK